MSAETELAECRKKCSEYHRRAQQAEAACADFEKQWKAKGGPSGGSFGRALLAVRCTTLSEHLTAAISLLASCMADSDAELRARLDKMTVEELFAAARANIERAGG